MTATAQTIDFAGLPEPELVRLARLGRGEAFRVLIQRCNQPLFRTARSVMRDDSEAEDVLQEAYVRAFQKLGHFRGESSLLTWLTRIVLNEARDRLRKRRTMVELDAVERAQEAGQVLTFPSGQAASDPERDASRAEARRLLEHAVDELPENFRLVFILREVDGRSVEETADSLGVLPATVKTRLHRARRMLRESLDARLASALDGAFPFLGARCGRITEAVLARLQATGLAVA